MSRIEPSSRTTLAILLGASEWPNADLSGSPAFAHSASKIRGYLLGSFELPRENFLDLFDKQISLSEVDAAISEFLETRIEHMKAGGQPARDLLFYYIGHGIFAEGQDQAYHLAIRSTRKGNLRTSAISIVALSETLKAKARYLRRLVILDSCFSGVAAKYMQSNTPGQAAIQQTISAFKGNRQGGGFSQRGTALLCSSSRDLVSYRLRDESGTMFSEALVRVLTLGNKYVSTTHLSLSDLRDSIEEVLERLAEEKNLVEEKPPRPEIHSPDQSEGNVAKVPFFPNVAVSKDPIAVLPIGQETPVSVQLADVYRDLVEKAWKNGILEQIEIQQLTTYAKKLSLHQEQVAAIEQQVMGDTKEGIWYRKEVEAAWVNHHLSKERIAQLNTLASQCSISPEDAAAIEREIMEDTKEGICQRQLELQYLDQYRREVKAAWKNRKLDDVERISWLQKLAAQLNLTKEAVAAIEREVMGDLKEHIWQQQQLELQYLDRYRREVKAAWKDHKLDERGVNWLQKLAAQLNLTKEAVAAIEREVMGNLKESILQLVEEGQVLGQATPQPHKTRAPEEYLYQAGETDLAPPT